MLASATAAPERVATSSALSRSRSRIEDLLLTSLLRSFAYHSGQRRLLLELEGHGREGFLTADLDLSRTVGWLTATWPVLLELANRRV